MLSHLTFPFQNICLFCFSNNQVHVGNLKHPLMSAHKDTCMSCKGHSPPGVGLPELRNRALLARGPSSYAWTRLCYRGFPTAWVELSHSPGALAAQLLPGAEEWAQPARLCHHPPEEPCWCPAPGNCWPPQCLEALLSINHRAVFSDCRAPHWVTRTTTAVFALQLKWNKYRLRKPKAKSQGSKWKQA